MGLVVDKLTGNIYLFDFTGGGGGSGSTTPYQEVNTYSQLPSAASNNGIIYVVRESSGSYVLNRKEAGLYYSNGITWRRLGDIPSFFNTVNFKLYDGTDTSKEVMFNFSGNTSNSLRKITLRNSNGTIAYLTDLDTKLDTSIFANYTANTAPNQFVGIIDFNSYTASTEILFDSKQDNIQYLQVIDLVGGINVNTVTPTPINWTNVQFSGTSLEYTGGSRIYIRENGNYEIAYNLVSENQTNTEKVIGTLIRLNGIDDITPLTETRFVGRVISYSATNSISDYKLTLNDGDYIQLLSFRIGSSGNVLTKPNASWIKITKI